MLIQSGSLILTTQGNNVTFRNANGRGIRLATDAADNLVISREDGFKTTSHVVIDGGYTIYNGGANEEIKITREIAPRGLRLSYGSNFAGGEVTWSNANLLQGGWGVRLGIYSTGSVYISGSSAATTALVGLNNHLVLSSTVGTITVSGNLKVTGHIIENALQATASVNTTAVVVDSFLTTDYRTMKYIFSISSGSYYQSQEALVLHNGTTVEYVEYGILTLPASTFVGFTASITGSTLNIIASGSLAENAIKYIRHAVVI